MGRSGRTLRAMLSGLGCMLCIGLLVCLAMQSGTTQGAKATPPSVANMESFVTPTTRVGRPMESMSLDPFVATKRRVPNGPDPIHNRYL